MRKVILASASPRRSELLYQIGMTFEVIPSIAEEDMNINLEPEALVQQLAFEKAQEVSERIKSIKGYENAIVIGADTVVVSEGVLGKPETEKMAYQMLKALGGRWHEVLTGISIIEANSMRALTGCEKTSVKIRELSDDIIYSYIKTGEPMDKAGSYGIQGIGAILVEEINGCYYNVVGLPLAKLFDLLDELGIKVL